MGKEFLEMDKNVSLMNGMNLLEIIFSQVKTSMAERKKEKETELSGLQFEAFYSSRPSIKAQTLIPSWPPVWATDPG